MEINHSLSFYKTNFDQCNCIIPQGIAPNLNLLSPPLTVHYMERNGRASEEQANKNLL